MRSAKMTNSNRFLNSERVVAKAHFEGINGQKCSTSEDLKKALNQKKVFLFVSIFSDDFREPELDAMLSALCGKQANVVIVVVDGIQGINLVDLDYGSLSYEQIKEQVFEQGTVAANDWIRNSFNVLSKYTNQNSSIQIRLCLKQMKNIFQFSECESIINELLNSETSKAKQLQEAIQATVNMHLKNKENRGDQFRTQKYIEIELAYYMALACDSDFIAYTNKEPPAFKFVRNLVKDYKQRLGNKDSAGYIEFSLDRKNPADLPQTSIEKIKLTGGVSGEYPNGNIKSISDLMPTRRMSCPVPEEVISPQTLQRRRSRSSITPPLICQKGFFTKPKEDEVPKQVPSIGEIIKDVAERRYHEALQKLVMHDNTVSSTIKREWLSQIQQLIRVEENYLQANLLDKMLIHTESDKPVVNFKGPGGL
jgi:hypothetical protein